MSSPGAQVPEYLLEVGVVGPFGPQVLGELPGLALCGGPLRGRRSGGMAPGLRGDCRPTHRLPALAAGRGAQDGPQRLRVTLGESQRAAARSLRADAVSTEKEVVNVMPDATSTGSARDRRWLILGVIGQRS